MNSLERVLQALEHKEADRVPYFLHLSMHGAKSLKMSLKEYFSKGSYLAEGQLLLQKRFGHDCLNGFAYAAIEIEAWGGEVIFHENGPPNSGKPMLHSPAQISKLKAPDPYDSPALKRVLDAIGIMKDNVGSEVPIIGVVISPFSLPVMQMGFPTYLDYLEGNSQELKQLLETNIEFCIQWANAQMKAGATVICYFDPISSPTCITPNRYREIGLPVARKVFSGIEGPTVTHFASGRVQRILDNVVDTGTLALGVGVDEDLKDLKDLAEKKIALIGNLNGVEMCRWTPKEARRKVKEAIAIAGKGGGFILSDSHGEIPWDVSFEVLDAIRDGVEEYGQYPII